VFIASNVNCQSGTALICCCDATAAAERRAAIDRYFLPVGRSAAKPQQRRSNDGINQSINFYLLKMSRDTHKRLFNCEQDNKAEISTNSCPSNKLYYERKGKLNAYKIAYGGVHIHLPGFI